MMASIGMTYVSKRAVKSFEVEKAKKRKAHLEQQLALEQDDQKKEELKELLKNVEEQINNHHDEDSGEEVDEDVFDKGIAYRGAGNSNVSLIIY